MLWWIITGLLMVVTAVATAFWCRRSAKQQPVENNHDDVVAQKQKTIELLMALMVDSARDYNSGNLSVITTMFEESSRISSETSQSMGAIVDTIMANQNNITSISEHSRSASQIADQGVGIVRSVNDAMQEFLNARDDMDRIQQQMQFIQEKASAIRHIGQEAEMLALNAAIEAARAGDAGRGFAVVADNMKGLAQNSQTSTGEIEKILDAAGGIINQSTGAIARRADQLSQGVENLLTGFDELTQSINQISDSAEQATRDGDDSVNTIKQLAEKSRSAMEGQIKQIIDLTSKLTGHSINDLSPQDAKQKLNKFDQLIDVRTQEEFNGDLGHIEGARLYPLSDNLKDKLEQLDKSGSYLFICRSGGRSAKAAQMALIAGFNHVYNLEGGMLAWRQHYR